MDEKRCMKKKWLEFKCVRYLAIDSLSSLLSQGLSPPMLLATQAKVKATIRRAIRASLWQYSFYRFESKILAG